jgi:hypothetical protein
MTSSYQLLSGFLIPSEEKDHFKFPNSWTNIFVESNKNYKKEMREFKDMKIPPQFFLILDSTNKNTLKMVT